MKFKLLSARIFITSVILFLPFIPVALANIGQTRHQSTALETIENIYGYFMGFPFVYIIDYFTKISHSDTIPIFGLIAIILDSYINSVIINNVFDFLKQKVSMTLPSKN